MHSCWGWFFVLLHVLGICREAQYYVIVIYVEEWVPSVDKALQFILFFPPLVFTNC